VIAAQVRKAPNVFLRKCVVQLEHIALMDIGKA
jgi:hypothetical protein